MTTLFVSPRLTSPRLSGPIPSTPSTTPVYTYQLAPTGPSRSTHLIDCPTPFSPYHYDCPTPLNPAHSIRSN